MIDAWGGEGEGRRNGKCGDSWRRPRFNRRSAALQGQAPTTGQHVSGTASGVEMMAPRLLMKRRRLQRRQAETMPAVSIPKLRGVRGAGCLVELAAVQIEWFSWLGRRLKIGLAFMTSSLFRAAAGAIPGRSRCGKYPHRMREANHE